MLSPVLKSWIDRFGWRVYISVSTQFRSSGDFLGSLQLFCYDMSPCSHLRVTNCNKIKKSMYRSIEDLISANNSLSYRITPMVNIKQKVFLMNILNSTSAKWRSVLKASTDVIVIDPFQIPTVRILDASSKQIFKLFLLNRNWHKLMNNYAFGKKESRIREF